MIRFFLHCFRSSPLAGIYNLIHWLLFPRMATVIRSAVQVCERRLLDLACGTGIYALSIAGQKRELSVLGIDMQDVRCTTAARIAHSMGLAEVEFRQGDIFDMQETNVDGILLCDVLCYYPPEKQYELLSKLVDMLAPDGCLFIKDHQVDSRWRGVILRLEERVGRALRRMLRTETDSAYHGRILYPRSSTSRLQELKALGFDVDVQRLDQWSLLPHVLYVARRTGMS